MKLRWLGTNGFEFRYRGQSILLDPYVTRRMDLICDPAAVSKYITDVDTGFVPNTVDIKYGAWSMGHKKFAPGPSSSPCPLPYALCKNKQQHEDEMLPETKRSASTPRVETIIIGHSHWDHLADAPEIAKRTGASILGSLTTVNICKSLGVASSQLKVCEAGDIMEFGDFTVNVLPSLHKQPMLYPGAYSEVPKKIESIEDFLEGGTFALLFDFCGLRVLNLGSANFIPEALNGLNCDCLLVGISGRADNFMSELMSCISTKLIIPTHFDYFDTPMEQSGERISMASFLQEMQTVAPEVAITRACPRPASGC
jgi:L-ascorbate metabolism protein UlaG (beta-lactamase superfamily)